jgi:hypothetical protein
VLRILRLLRLTQLAPAMRAMFSLDGIRYAALLALVTLVGGAEAFSAAQNVSIGDSLYWAVTTMTTVGYSNVAPTTALAKVVACVVMLVGAGFFALLTGAIARQFLATQPDDRTLRRQLEVATGGAAVGHPEYRHANPSQRPAALAGERASAPLVSTTAAGARGHSVVYVLAAPTDTVRVSA